MKEFASVNVCVASLVSEDTWKCRKGRIFENVKEQFPQNRQSSLWKSPRPFKVKVIVNSK